MAPVQEVVPEPVAAIHNRAFIARIQRKFRRSPDHEHDPQASDLDGEPGGISPGSKPLCRLWPDLDDSNLWVPLN